MTRIFSGALQYALGMLMVRGLTILFKRFIPFATTSFGFMWGLGVDPLYYLKYAYAYVAYAVNYVTAYAVYYAQMAEYYVLIANRNIELALPFDPVFLYLGVGITLILLSFSRSQKQVEPVVVPTLLTSTGKFDLYDLVK